MAECRKSVLSSRSVSRIHLFLQVSPGSVFSHSHMRMSRFLSTPMCWALWWVKGVKSITQPYTKLGSVCWPRHRALYKGASLVRLMSYWGNLMLLWKA